MSTAALQRQAEMPAADPINEALVLYTGFGRAAFPRARTADVAARFGERAAAELKLRILALFEELGQPVPEAIGKGARRSMTERAVEQLRGNHPELDEGGLRVLAWIYSFGLR